MKKLLITTVLAALPMIAAPAFAADELNVSNGISAAGAPLAMHGADPVALLTKEQVVQGTAMHTHNHDGASYYFASAANKDEFAANPEKYVPQHGGFCSFGVSVGKKFDGDPDQFVVMDGKLHLFLNEQTRALWLEDTAKASATADKNWERIETISVQELAAS